MGFSFDTVALVGLLSRGNFDKTRCLFYGTAGTGGNSAAQWLDESGHGNHLVRPDPGDSFVLTTDPAGFGAYHSSNLSGGFFQFPFPNLPAGEYTVAIALRPDSLQSPYLLDAKGHSVGLGFNDSDLGAYRVGGVSYGAGTLGVAANEGVVLGWRLGIADGGRAYKNSELKYSGPYPSLGASFDAPAGLGHDNLVYYGAFTGYLYGLAFVQGTLTDSEFLQLQLTLAAPAGLSL